MADNGVSTTNLNAATIVDDILGNYGGSSVRLPIARLIEQVKGQVGPTYATLAQLNADLNWNAGAVAGVFGDGTAANNGIYLKSGLYGAGSWTRIGELGADIGKSLADA
ncbi:hypothetical protein, partial [Acidimangrovimonas sediminis]|uniref:hypothetical protein n=1 Tax=Acidimangrovimonas sediminis TaxID=2056283 RepID=UPI0018ED9A7A